MSDHPGRPFTYYGSKGVPFDLRTGPAAQAAADYWRKVCTYAATLNDRFDILGTDDEEED